ncbi:hypothetical protein FNV43_RR10857 [Rhamnella rubrinervis]|uniref:Peroxidase n=1 Tax=Rhamnella rubrinervis TaxID=2594499 RepID=A0A8K0H4H4_9ROSA|nr:hypothetical protein FNV43_RR10857 [Rhamnella rubrinervis]
MKLHVVFLIFTAASVLGFCHGGKLRKNFYDETCSCAEDIVQKATWDHVSANPAVPARLLRMHFHDCFVRGCDGSVLLNSTGNSRAEKEAVPNLTLIGFDVIDDIKAKVEDACPGVVSCADILALAARDAVSFQFKKSMWEVLTGRRDGTVSLMSEASANIPSPFMNLNQLKKNFANKGLNLHDLVVLSGGHTIGVSHCSGFRSRLFNFTGKGDQDPSLDPAYAEFLKKQCKDASDSTTVVEMDPQSALDFDSNYYSTVLKHKGLFTSDAALITNNASTKIVKELVETQDFFTEFAQSMKRMGAIQVLTGTAGQIRKRCWVVNS